MNKRTLLPCGIAALLLTILAGCSLMRPPEVVASASPATLLDTNWRLTQLGSELVDNPVGERQFQITLQSGNTNMAGFAGCNRLFGRYALEGDLLKFDGIGGTKMFCEGRMDLEQKLSNALMSVVRWRITGRTLELLDERGTAAATFVASPAAS